MTQAEVIKIMRLLEKQAYARMVKMQCIARMREAKRECVVVVDSTPARYGDVTCEASTVMPNKGGPRYVWRYQGHFLRGHGLVMKFLAEEYDRISKP